MDRHETKHRRQPGALPQSVNLSEGKGSVIDGSHIASARKSESSPQNHFRRGLKQLARLYPGISKRQPVFSQVMHLPFFLPWKTRESRSCWRERRLPPSRLRLTQHGIGVDMWILGTFPAVVEGHDRSAAMAVELEAGALLAQRHPASRTGRKEWGPMTHAADSSFSLGVHDQLLLHVS